jgi:hypothetical protein
MQLKDGLGSVLISSLCIINLIYVLYVLHSQIMENTNKKLVLIVVVIVDNNKIQLLHHFGDNALL